MGCRRLPGSETGEVRSVGAERHPVRACPAEARRTRGQDGGRGSAMRDAPSPRVRSTSRVAPSVLHIHRPDRADGLVDALATLLAEPPQDPFASEVVAVPTRGMERWLTQRLSTTL